MIDEIIWKDIKGYENYQISNIGIVKSLDRIIIDKNNRPMKYKGKILKPLKNGNGYFYVVLPQKKYIYIHRLVATHFVDNPNNEKVIDHINNNKSDNNYTNLQWCSQQFNNRKSHLGNSYGSKNKGRKHTELELIKMSNSMKGKNIGKPSPFKGKKCCMTRDNMGRFVTKQTTPQH